MRILQFLYHLYIIKLYVQKLVNRFERSSYCNIILQLHGYFVVYQRLEEAV